MGNVGKERGGVNIGGDDTRYDLVSGVSKLWRCEVVSGSVEGWGKSYVPIRMATKHIGPAERVIGDLPEHRFVVGYKVAGLSNAVRDSFR